MRSTEAMRVPGWVKVVICNLSPPFPLYSNTCVIAPFLRIAPRIPARSCVRVMLHHIVDFVCLRLIRARTVNCLCCSPRCIRRSSRLPPCFRVSSSRLLEVIFTVTRRWDDCAAGMAPNSRCVYEQLTCAHIGPMNNSTMER